MITQFRYPGTETGRLISGNFNVIATSGAVPSITMNGSYSDIAY
ncbi:hypothetical protein QRD02_05845 [Aequorivita sp. SDUM287046]|uniref:Uncharacterized protein n=1 Tax=Aequorivita aurantiaca TaxID=3053356 RepID=A0ABT8DEZ7_9FLAO|nr:hypothetical protein [Aequorivita aurantiaca]MDN3723896.1 hypothetical protein [Aequorivita aurantiaca]